MQFLVLHGFAGSSGLPEGDRQNRLRHGYSSPNLRFAHKPIFQTRIASGSGSCDLPHATPDPGQHQFQEISPHLRGNRLCHCDEPHGGDPSQDIRSFRKEDLAVLMVQSACRRRALAFPSVPARQHIQMPLMLVVGKECGTRRLCARHRRMTLGSDWGTSTADPQLTLWFREIPMLHLDTGNTGFMILCTSLVMLMTPGLAFFYGGLVGRENVLAIMIPSFVSMGWTTVIWYLYGYSLCFGGDWHGVMATSTWHFCAGSISPPPLCRATPSRHLCLRISLSDDVRHHYSRTRLQEYCTNRVTFKAYMLFFLTGWLTLVSFPFVHMVWGGGFLQQWGVKDFAGPHCGAQHRGHRRFGVGVAWGSGTRRIAGRIASHWLHWGPACCGSDGTGLTRTAKSDPIQ